MINVVSHVFSYDLSHVLRFYIWVSVEAPASPHLATDRHAVLFFRRFSVLGFASHDSNERDLLFRSSNSVDSLLLGADADLLWRLVTLLLWRVV